MEDVRVRAVSSGSHSGDRTKREISERPGTALPWVQTIKGSPYFTTEEGKDWTPIGQNDAITWPELNGLFRRKDLASVERYLSLLVESGVTCMRLMLEYSQSRYRYFENPVGTFQPTMIRLWDDLFSRCEKKGMRILLTPYDTFWMWLNWKHHPYNKKNGGMCDKRGQWLLCPQTRDAIKQRLLFATQRWGGSGALFAWDIWNEIHPAHAENSTAVFAGFISDVSGFLRDAELRLHGRAHPQTVSVFGPVLKNNPLATDAVFRHPALNFASVHFYESKTIDHPKNTVDAAISMGRLTKEAIVEIKDARPFFDSEHGPIHAFKDRRITLSEAFDDEYFRHMQWAHFASGGAGGGMRWPNRHPHSLTKGMRSAQRSLARFLPLIHWKNFKRLNWNDVIKVSNGSLHPFACGDERQAVVYLLRRDTIAKDGTLRKDVEPLYSEIVLPMDARGNYEVIAWGPTAGRAIATLEIRKEAGQPLQLQLPPVLTDLALAVRKKRDE